MIAIRGFGSQLAQLFLDFLPDWDDPVPVERGSCNTTAERHLFCQGLLNGKIIGQQTAKEIADTFEANFNMVVRQCDLIIGTNDKARICVIGSESGFAGSFDGAYAGAKAALHRYVETKKLRTPDQQLICIAPGIVDDLGMTTRRMDYDKLARREKEHPKGRFLHSSEVCRLVKHVLYVDDGYLSGTVIRMNGGEHIK
jgi:NAD(P)-dependent dehydrogenase (short-subunit alcohol dehydrogenase family)